MHLPEMVERAHTFVDVGKTMVRSLGRQPPVSISLR